MKNRVILCGQSQRNYAKQLIDGASPNCVVTIAQPTRTVLQNAKVWAMLTDISKQKIKPNGKKGTPESWKGIIMQACGHAIQFEIGLDGDPFPMGHKSSQLTISQCADMIEFMYFYGAEQNVVWKELERMDLAE